MNDLLSLPFLIALAIGLHALAGRGAKVLASVLSPLATGEPEACSYERQVYGTPERAMLAVVGLALAAGLLFWLGMVTAWRFLAAIGGVALVAAVALDLSRWQRVTASAEYVWFQRGLGQKVHQVAIENIRDVRVIEGDAPGFTLRHLRRNRICRLAMRMRDKRIVALPKTDAHTGLDAVEAMANHIRSRQRLLEAREATREKPARPAKPPAPRPTDRELLRELKKLRQRALDAELPPAAAAPPRHKG